MRKIIAYTLTWAVVVTGVPAGPGSAVASRDTLRTEATQQGAGVEELKARLAGVEEKPTREDAEKIFSDPHGYAGWEGLSPEQRTTLIDQYVDPAHGFDVTYAQFQKMTALLDAPVGVKLGPLGKNYPISDEKPGPFPRRRPQSPEEIKRGRLLMPTTAVLLGAGGAGSRLFDDIDNLFQARDSLLPDMKRWDTFSAVERQSFVVRLNAHYRKVLKKEDSDPGLVPETQDVVTPIARHGAEQWLSQRVESETVRLVSDLGLPSPDGLQRIKSEMDQGLSTKPTFRLWEGGPTPLQIWLETIAGMDPETPVVIGTSIMTDRQIQQYVVEAYQGQHGSPAETYFGLRGPIGFITDAVIPVFDSKSGKLAMDFHNTGQLAQGGAGGAGSLEAMGRRVKLLQPGASQVVEGPSSAFEWLRGQGRENLFIGDADTVGTTPELIYSALGLLERHDAKAVAFAYPYPYYEEDNDPGLGRLVNVIMDAGVPGKERRALVSREASELDTVSRFREAIKDARKKPGEVSANAGVYLVKLDALELLVKAEFPWHKVTRPGVIRFEKFKPDVPELLAAASDKPFYFPILEVPDGDIVPIKDTGRVGRASGRRFSLSLWPRSSELSLNNTEVVIPYSAFAGRGDAAHLAKTIDALNARGVVPTVLLLDEGEGAQAAQQKLNVVLSDFPQAKAVFVPQNQMKPFSKRPMILEIFTVISDDLRNRAQDHVKQVAAQNRSGQKPVVLAIHAPPSRESWIADPTVADTLNLFMELPAQGQGMGEGSLYSGYLYDRVLQGVTLSLKTSSRQEFRNALLSDLDREAPLAQELDRHGMDPNTFLDSFWVFRYTSVLGNPAEQHVLIEAMRRLDRPVVVFTFYNPENDNRPDYASKYRTRYTGHTPLVEKLLAEPGVNFLDLSGHYSAKTKVQPGVKVTVVNLPALTQPAVFTRLMGASDQADVTGLFTLLESLGFVFNGVGPTPLYLSTQDLFESLLTQPLSQSGNHAAALQLIETLARPARGDSAKEVINTAVDARVRLVTDSKTQTQYRSALSQIVASVPRRLKQPALMNHFNLLTDTLGAIDQGESLAAIVQKNHTAGAEESVADEDLAGELQALLAREEAKGIYPAPPSPSERFNLPGIPAWIWHMAFPKPPQVPGDYYSPLDEQRLQKRGEESLRWRSWYAHHPFTPMVRGQALFIAEYQGVHPMDAGKLGDMVDLARLLPGYRIQDNYGRLAEGGTYVHMGRSVPSHDHLHAIPLSFPADEMAPTAWETVAVAEGTTVERPTQFPVRIRRIVGNDRDPVVQAAASYVSILDRGVEQNPDQIQGYNTSVVVQNGRIEIYLVPRKLYQDSGLPYHEIGFATQDMMGGLITTDSGIYQRMKKDPAQAAQAVARLWDSLSTPEKTVRSFDEAFRAGAEETNRLKGMTTAEMGVLIGGLREIAEGQDLDAAIAARARMMSLREQAEAAAERSLRSPAGFYTPSEAPAPAVFFFNDSGTWRWALPVATTGAPVAVLVDRIAVAAGMEELFRRAGIPQGQYAVVSREAFGGDEEAALSALKSRFSPEVSFVQVPPRTGLAEVERFLRDHGVVFYTEMAAGVEEVDRYIASLT